MATPQAIAATGRAILGLLADNISTDEFANAGFKLYQTRDFENPMEEGISLFLYRVEVNASLRNLPGYLDLNGVRRRPPLPLDLYYLLTAWAKDALKQQRLLGWALRILEDAPVLPASLLNHFGPEPDVFRPDEKVELIIGSLSLQDISNLWTAFKISPPASVNYIARVIGIESTLTQTQFEPVQTREFEMAKN